MVSPWLWLNVEQIVVTFAEEVEQDYLAMGQDIDFANGESSPASDRMPADENERTRHPTSTAIRACEVNKGRTSTDFKLWKCSDDGPRAARRWNVDGFCPRLRPEQSGRHVALTLDRRPQRTLCQRYKSRHTECLLTGTATNEQLRGSVLFRIGPPKTVCVGSHTRQSCSSNAACGSKPPRIVNFLVENFAHLRDRSFEGIDHRLFTVALS